MHLRLLRSFAVAAVTAIPLVWCCQGAALNGTAETWAPAPFTDGTSDLRRHPLSLLGSSDKKAEKKKKKRKRDVAAAVDRVPLPAPVAKAALVLLEIENTGSEVYRDILHDASAHHGLKFCGVDCEQRNRWHRNAKWRQQCRTLVGQYVMGMCPGRAYFTGEEWVPCRTAVALRHPVDRVLASYLACQADEAAPGRGGGGAEGRGGSSRADHCAGAYLDASAVGYRRWAEHQKNFVILRLAADRENVLGPEHPEACANPAGCVHHTPCWYKHHQHVEIEGVAHPTFLKAMLRLEEMEVWEGAVTDPLSACGPLPW